MDLASGSRLGRYEIRSLLGAGGMGEVYLAYDHDLEREVALKVLRHGDGQGSDRARRFVQEARAASGLNHPNVAHVYEIGIHDDFRFIAMELVEGETLRDHAGRGQLSLDDVLSIGTQIASALAAAHKHGIVHRDIKPENVIVTPDGYAKVLDFGLAKLREIRGEDAATVLKTTPGVAMGTLSYMAPEQLNGGDITPAADVFSLGVVLYEMISGRRPFPGGTNNEIISAILSKQPRPLSELRPDTPPKLERVVAKALSKDASDRFPSAGELYEELRQITRETMSAAVPVVARPRVSKRIGFTALAVLVLALAAIGAWSIARSRRLRRAEESIKTAEGLVAQRKLPEAYETAVAAAAILPDNVRVRDVIAQSSEALSIASDPPGATVYMQRFKGPAERVRAGITPFTTRVPRADYVVAVEKSGYAPVLRPLAMTPVYVNGGRPPVSPSLRIKLIEATKVPAGMTWVSGGRSQLLGWARPSDRQVDLRDFLIDRFEVSNRDFEEFVRAGGYRRREFWKHPFLDSGKNLGFEEAMARFHDSNGLPGPRSWVAGAPPPGREDHPVTDVTWYEAAAFAEWKGKRLPTIFQWERAAQAPKSSNWLSLPWGVVYEGVDATERANFLGKGTMPVDSMMFGISPWGAYHMAGNVAEWCRNPKEPGFAFRGGGWNDAVYAFGKTGGYPAFYSSPTLGFRCIKDLTPDPGDQGDFALGASEVVPNYRPVDDRAFAEIRARYDYPKTPLNAQIVETVETGDWRREKIAYQVAGSTVFAYLYLPNGFRRPLQVIHFAPAGDVDEGFRTLPASIEILLPPYIRGGRAVFSVLLEGYVGRPRPPGFEEPDSRTTEYVDYVVKRVTELRRGLDYLETRKDLDSSRIAFMAPSAGSWTGLIHTAIDARYRSVILIGTGLRTRSLSDAAAANKINFAPRIAPPKLMVHGRYDENLPLKTNGEPLFRLFKEPKKLELYEGGHIPPQNVVVPIVQKWLDETLGPVQ